MQPFSWGHCESTPPHRSQHASELITTVNLSELHYKKERGGGRKREGEKECHLVATGKQQLLWIHTVCQGWKSSKDALFANPVISISIYFCLCLFISLSLLLLSSKVQPVKQVYRQRDTLDKLFIVSYSYVIFLLGGKWLGCSHKLSIYIGSTERSVLAVCLWPGVAGVEWWGNERGWRFAVAGPQRLSGWRSAQRWNGTNGMKSFVCVALAQHSRPGTAPHHHNLAISDSHSQGWSKLICLCVYCAPLNVIHPIRIRAIRFTFVVSLLYCRKFLIMSLLWDLSHSFFNLIFWFTFFFFT